MPRSLVYRDVLEILGPTMENQMKRMMENEMETLGPREEVYGICRLYVGFEDNGESNRKGTRDTVI